MITISNALVAILILVVVADIVWMRVEQRRLRVVERTAIQKSRDSTMVITLTCDDSQFQDGIARAIESASKLSAELERAGAAREKAQL